MLVLPNPDFIMPFDASTDSARLLETSLFRPPVEYIGFWLESMIMEALVFILIASLRKISLYSVDVREVLSIS